MILTPFQKRTILFDLRTCSDSPERGIPTYAQSLVLQFCRDNPDDRFLFWQHPDAPLPNRSHELAAFGEWCSEKDLAVDQALRIDVLMTAVFFSLPLQGRGKEGVFPRWLRRHAPITLGIVYDLIPFLFQDHYLPTAAGRSEYLQGIEVLRTYDRLFAISEATRQDTIRLAGVDPAKIFCLPGDIDDRKRTLIQCPHDEKVAPRFGLSGPYFIYVGGWDWRKNQEGLIREFSRFASGHSEWKLAIVCAMTEEHKLKYLSLAQECGIPPGNLICTGLVSDEELVALLKSAQAMVFPSFYEGLGLPILEAYAAGIPVLGADNSSIRDLVHPFCRFDPCQEGSIAASMTRFVHTSGIWETSLGYGQQALAKLGWDKSSAIVSASLKPLPSIAPGPGKPIIAVAGCLPPSESGIASYNLRTLQSEYWITHFFADLPIPMQRRTLDFPGLLHGNKVLPAAAAPLALRSNGYSKAVFVLGNSHHNLESLAALLASRLQGGVPRWIYLHEAILPGLWEAFFAFDQEQVRRFFQLHYPEYRDTCTNPERSTASPMGVRPLIQMTRPDGILVNSIACRDLIRQELGPESADLPIEVLFLPIDTSVSIKTPYSARQNGKLKVAHFGILGDCKKPALLVQAMTTLAKRRSVSLTFAGFDNKTYCVRHRFDQLPFIDILNSPSPQALKAAMSKVDVAVQLRFPTFGETSGVVSELIGLGKPVVVTNAGSFAEYPDALVSKVSTDVSPSQLADAIEAAALGPQDRELRKSLLKPYSQNAFARRFAEALDLEYAVYPLDKADPAAPFSTTALSHNKVCNLEDFSHPDLLPVLREVFSHELDRFGAQFPEGREYRKYWEVAMAIRAFKAGGVLRPDSDILGVGAGNEPTLFYLTNFVNRVFATDLYLTEGWEESANASMMTEPERHWPFKWNPRRLVVQHMNGMDLRYEDGTMDGVFSSSSIEHFGGWEEIGKALDEIHRVLKPGGIASISTEYLVSGQPGKVPGLQFFDDQALLEQVIRPRPWELLSPLDLRVSSHTLATEADLHEVSRDQQRQIDRLGGHFTFLLTYAHYPHILLRLEDRTFTSVHLALRKK